MCGKILIIAFLCVPVGVCLADKKTVGGAKATVPRTYGGAVVERITGIDEGFGFRCDIKGWPGVIAEDMTVRIDGIGPPLIVTQGNMPNEFFQLQVRKFLERTFAKERTVRLENIKRGRTFCIVADVIVDSNSLADLLIEDGLARRYTQGQAHIDTERPGEHTQAGVANEAVYVASKNSKMYHRAECRYAKTISAANLVRFDSTGAAAQTGRRACKTCNP
jgi:endonuclease YncB( thermonuclease family)